MDAAAAHPLQVQRQSILKGHARHGESPGQSGPGQKTIKVVALVRPLAPLLGGGRRAPVPGGEGPGHPRALLGRNGRSKGNAAVGGDGSGGLLDDGRGPQGAG